MTEIRQVWQLLRKMMPAMMARPSLLAKRAKLTNPNELTAKKQGYNITIAAEVWVSLPKQKPQTIPVAIEVNGLELTNDVNIDLRQLKQGRPEELVKAMFLATLLAQGIFNNDRKRKAFEQIIR